jgi:hypothetical protein
MGMSGYARASSRVYREGVVSVQEMRCLGSREATRRGLGIASKAPKLSLWASGMAKQWNSSLTRAGLHSFPL